MKKYLFLFGLVLLAVFNCHAQKEKKNKKTETSDNTGSADQLLKLDSATQQYIVREVVPCDSALSRQKLYEICKDWIVRNLKSSDNNILLDDKEFKQLTATGALKTSDMPVTWACSIANCALDFKLTINIKEGKIRYTFENMVHYGTNNCSNPPSRITTPLEQWNRKIKLSQQVFADIEIKLKSLTDNLKSALSQTAEKKDDW